MVKRYYKKRRATKEGKARAARNKRKMYESNKMAKLWMWTHGYHDIFINPHTRHSKDMFGLFDGVCFDKHGVVSFFQIKTNKFGKISDIKAFTKDRRIKALILNHDEYINAVKVRMFIGGDEVMNDETMSGEEREELDIEDEEEEEEQQNVEFVDIKHG